MSTATIVRDVNAEFDVQRAGQIETAKANQARWQARIDSGEMVATGNGRYRVTQGWDAGEVFTLGANGLLLPQSGLDTADGVAQGFFDQPEWHDQGNVVLGGLSDIDEVLKLSGLDFYVDQRKVRFHAGGKLLTVEDAFVNFRDDTLAPLGVVGKIYTPVQNRQAFEFLQEMVRDGQARFATAFPMREGKRCIISMELPKGIVIDAEGIGDFVKLYLAVFNNHDGQGKFEAKITPWRPRCKNTERLASKHAVTTWGVRHTTSAPARVDEARRQLKMVDRYAEAFRAEQEQLAATAATFADVEQLIDSVWKPEDKPGKVAERRAGERKDTFRGLWDGYSGELGKTAYAAERVFTDYFDHVAPRRPGADGMAAARATAALEGLDDVKKNRVHAQLLTLKNA